MGWYFRYDLGKGEHDAYLRREIVGEGSGDYEILDSATVNLSEWYAAVRGPEGEVHAVVCAIKFVRGGEFGYKPMDEGMGPYCYNCPERILALLSDPAPNEYARIWRENCRSRLAQRKAKARLKEGMIVRLIGAEHYNNFDLYGDTFTVESYRSWRYRRPLRVYRSHKSRTLVRYGRSAKFEVVA